MKVECFSLCDFAQENNGKLTVVGTFDTIIVRKFPCVHQQLSVVIRLRFDLWEFGEHGFRIESHGLDNEETIEPILGRVMVQGGGNATAVSHLVFSVVNLRFRKNGIFNFVLLIDEKEIMSIPLYVRKG